MLYAPPQEIAGLRYDVERTLHDDVAVAMSALVIELDLVAGEVNDASVCARLAAIRGVMCGIIDDFRATMGMIYPALLGVGELGPALSAVAENRGLRLRLDLPRHQLGAQACARTGLLVVDHLNRLVPGTAVRVRVRGRKVVRVSILDRRPELPEWRRHWAVLRCG